MDRIDQAVILVWGENERHEVHAVLASRYKLTAKLGELGRGGAIRQFAGSSLTFTLL